MRMGKLEDVLRRTAELVVSCSEKSYLYMVAILSMVAIGWDVAYQFRQLLVAIGWDHLKEALKAIKADNRAYSLDDEELMVQMAILKPDRTGEDANAMENALSRAYLVLSLRDALEAERSKLQIEHSRSEDAGRCRLIEHLIGVIDSATNDRQSKKVKKLFGE
ncbi:protein MID1-COMPLEMENTING ACTIVITY 1-like [Punica granatum]|uniref:Protein MID1-COMPLEMENTING ACTIVITY 1-like n=1 Tax=Punica granatum TaxID=22663 RepID=A0A6P8CYT0_PUNGR|nr:protein MID1-COMPLEMENTING ACTIVITY 1-like [Punica granatum]